MSAWLTQSESEDRTIDNFPFYEVLKYAMSKHPETDANFSLERILLQCVGLLVLTYKFDDEHFKTVDKIISIYQKMKYLEFVHVSMQRSAIGAKLYKIVTIDDTMMFGIRQQLERIELQRDLREFCK